MKTYFVRSTAAVYYNEKLFPSKECGLRERDSKPFLSEKRFSDFPLYSNGLFFLWGHNLSRFVYISQSSCHLLKLSFHTLVALYISTFVTIWFQKPKIHVPFKFEVFIYFIFFFFLLISFKNSTYFFKRFDHVNIGWCFMT